MNVTHTAIATISWARNEAETNLLQSSLHQLASSGLPIFITDAGSEQSFLRYLEGLPGTKLAGPVKGVWPQAKASINAAAESGAEWILYTEPDKKDFFTHHVNGLLQRADTTGNTGVHLASRSPKAFESFPSFQQMTETTINRCCAELMGYSFDYVYGPFLFHRSLVPYLQELPSDIGWGWRPFLFLTAHRLGKKLSAFEGDFFCPEDQREDDEGERIYRMRQMVQNINGMTMAADGITDCTD
jgi:hypothetical protein